MSQQPHQPPAKNPLKSLTIKGQFFQSLFVIWMFIKLLLLQIQAGDAEGLFAFLDANKDTAVLAVGLVVTASVTVYGRFRAVLPISFGGLATSRTERLFRAAPSAGAVLLCLCLVACATWTPEQVESHRQQVASLQRQSQTAGAVVDQLEVQLEAAQAAGDQAGVGKILDELKDARSGKAKFDERLAAYRDSIEDAKNGAQVFGGAATTAAPLLPPPWGLILGAVGAVIAAGGAEAARRSNANAKSLVTAVEQNKVDGVVDFELSKEKIKDAMTPGARRLVKKVQDKI